MTDATRAAVALLETPRLRLREWRPADWQAFRPIAGDPEVMRFIAAGRPWSDDEVRAFVERQVAGAARRGYCLWALEEKADGELIGHCGLQPLGTSGETEIGWWLARHRWRQGLASEAARCALRFGFEVARLSRVVAIAHAENLRSIAIMQKLGMHFERRAWGAELGLRQPEVEVVLYAIERP